MKIIQKELPILKEFIEERERLGDMQEDITKMNRNKDLFLLEWR